MVGDGVGKVVGRDVVSVVVIDGSGDKGIVSIVVVGVALSAVWCRCWDGDGL